MRAVQLALEDRPGLGRRQPRAEHPADGGAEEAEGGAGDHVDGDRAARALPAHDHRAVVAPHRQRGGFVDRVAQLGDGGEAQPDAVEPVDGDQADVERERPQVVARGERVLLDQAAADQADQVAVGLGGRHVGGGGDAMSLSIIERLPNTIALRMPMPTSRDWTPCFPSSSAHVSVSGGWLNVLRNGKLILEKAIIIPSEE